MITLGNVGGLCPIVFPQVINTMCLLIAVFLVVSLKGVDTVLPQVSSLLKEKEGKSILHL